MFLMEKIKKKIIILCLIVIFMFSLLFNTMKIVIITDQKNISISSAEGQWTRSNNNKYTGTYSIAALSNAISFNILSNTEITIQGIRLYWGDMPIKKFAITDIPSVIQFDNSFTVNEDSFLSFSACSLNISMFLANYKLILKLLYWLILIIFVIVIFNLGKNSKALMLINKNKLCSNIFRFKVNLYKHYKYVMDVVLCLIIFSKLNYHFNFMHQYELVFLLIAFILVSLSITPYIDTHKKFFICSSIIIIPLFFSLERLTDYLLVDEPRAIDEQLYLVDDTLTHWLNGNSRINYVIMGILLKWIPTFYLDYFNISSYQYAKLLHWLLGIILTVIICRTVTEKCIKDSKSLLLSFFIMFCGLLSLCVYLYTLKFYNYDTFAVLFGTLGAIYLYLSIKKQSSKLSLFALAILSLSMLEKSIAIPYWGISLLVCAYLHSLKWSKRKREFIIKSSLAAILTMLMPIVISYISSLFVCIILRECQFPPITLTDIILPFTGSFSLAARKLLNVSLGDDLINIIIILIMVIGIWIATLLLHIFVTKLSKKDLAIFGILPINSLLKCSITICWMIGILFLYIQPTMYIAPAYENVNNYYIATNQIDAATVYFPTKNSLQNILYFICALWGTGVDAFPTLILFWGFLYLILNKYDKDMAWNIIVAFTVVVIPIVYGIAKLTPWLRYMNVYICVAFVFILVKFCQHINYIVKKHNTLKGIAFSTIVLVISAIETYSFAPVYSSFWPIWNICAYQHENLDIGEVMIVWQGEIGADLSLAGNKILKYCAENEIASKNIKIYSNYHGLWNSEYSVFRMPGWVKNLAKEYPDISLNDFDFSDEAFYVFCRWGNTCGMTPYTMPLNIEPALTVTYRGATEAWIYTGRQMQNYISDFINNR